MRVRRALAAAVTGGVIWTSSVAAQTPAAPDQPRPAAKAVSGPESADVEFIRKAMDGGTHEIDAGRLAAKNAASAEVQAFARQMVDDHSKSNAELTSLVSLQTPTPAQKPAAEHTLGDLTGPAFDRAYMTRMVADHQATVELFEAEARDGKDDAVRKWAAQKLPTIRQHLEKARQIHATLGQ
jgi:putative membrane protein